MENKKITVVGGDLRNAILAGSLSKVNNVSLYGFDKAEFNVYIEQKNNLEEALDDSDIVIGPLPCSNDNETINAPFHSEKILINEVFRMMKKNQIFIAGHINSKIIQMSGIYNVYTIDILDREEMAVMNAIPTAEGAIQVAMEEMPITIHDCNAMVLGYGRIGKTLSKYLKALEAKVYVEARKRADLAWIESSGYIPVHIESMDQYLSKMDVIFNTIPFRILYEKNLKIINKETLIIDLASKPGGVDLEAAKTFGIKTIWALSLPGKVAPLTAAKYIKNTINNIIEELGV